MQKSALIIDDEADIRQLAALSLIRVGIDAHTAANLAEGRALLQERSFDVCLTDMRLPDGSGLDFVLHAKAARPDMPIAVITAHGDIVDAVEAMRRGAFDFVSKPIEVRRLRQIVTQALCDATPSGSGLTKTRTGLDAGATEMRGELRGRERVIGDSEVMRELLEIVRKVSRTNAPVWITGESGTGKELIARMIHDNSSRADAPFTGVNCGAIPSELMESEFFGHRKGSFTGAADDHVGLFQRSEGGTLFLDEVAELPIAMQVKLLRAIQERRIRPVGAVEEIPVDTRLLSASHKDLAAEVESGRFRHDLYYRLNVIGIRAPALRERREDIPALAQHILRRVCSGSGEPRSVELAEDAKSILSELDYPGNVRELENILERAIAMVDGNVICAEDLQSDRFSPGQPLARNPNEDVVSAEHRRILAVLERARWNRKVAAQELGMTYRQLRYRIQQLDINSSR